MDKINIEQYEKLVKILEEYPSLHTEFEDSQCSHIKKICQWSCKLFDKKWYRNQRRYWWIMKSYSHRRKLNKIRKELEDTKSKD